MKALDLFSLTMIAFDYLKGYLLEGRIFLLCELQGQSGRQWVEVDRKQIFIQL